MIDVTLSGPAWAWANRIADRVQPLRRGKFFVLLSAALEYHLALTDARGISRAVAIELSIADAVAALELHEIKPLGPILGESGHGPVDGAGRHRRF